MSSYTKQLRKHGYISMSREMLYRCNSGLFPLFTQPYVNTRGFREFYIVMKTFDCDMAKIHPKRLPN